MNITETAKARRPDVASSRLCHGHRALRIALAALGAAASCAFAGELPLGYEQVAYIQGDGQSGYILTDYVPQPNRDKIVLGSSNGNDCKVVNTVISNNRVSMPSGAISTTFVDGAANVRYSLYPEASGGGNVAGPAVFVAKGKAGYLLERGTPGAGAGDASIWSAEALDLAGKPRIGTKGGISFVDMGCYQWAVDGFFISIR